MCSIRSKQAELVEVHSSLHSQTGASLLTFVNTFALKITRLKMFRWSSFYTSCITVLVLLMLLTNCVFGH